GSTTADSTMMIITQKTTRDTAQGSATQRIERSQIAIESIARDEFESTVLVFGAGIISDEITRSMRDSILIVAPLALLFVLLVLIIAYRDLLDIALGLFGILLVLAWTFGFMGWMGYNFNQIFIAIPVLLIGLGIDYAIHVFMRHREERSRDANTGDVREAMMVALASVGVALGYVTATTVIGFLSNLISSVPPIRQFGVTSAFGILSAFIIFGALIPAIKVEMDSFLESKGIDRNKRAFGTGGGRLGRALSLGVFISRRAPWAILIIALIASVAGGYGATKVNTSFEQSDFLASDPPEWTQRLPEPFKPGDYDVKEALDFVNENFVRENSQIQLLIRGNVTNAAVLQRLHRASSVASNRSGISTLPTGEADISSPVTVMRSIAKRNQSFNRTLMAADVDGDGVPDRNISTIYDRLFQIAPQEAQSVIHRSNGNYKAVRFVVSVKGGASGDLVTALGDDLEQIVEGPGVRVIATGSPIVFDLVSDQLLETVIQSLAITLIAIFLFLMMSYRITEGSATLGLVTLLPVAFSVTWIVGTMYLLGIPFNVLTGMITSLTIGLGVAYSIHISERFSYELKQDGSVWAAMERT
ncbi:MAG: RND family transporter, partial [Halobacteriaceae archaeon]